jgi:glutathione S-transferase
VIIALYENDTPFKLHVVDLGDAFPNVRAYRSRLNAWPSVARMIDEARPYRHFLPLGAPDRD